MEINKKYAEKKREYNSDKISVKIQKSTHEKMKSYCEKNNIKMKDFLDKVILNSI